VNGVPASTNEGLVPSMDQIRAEISMTDAQAERLQTHLTGWSRAERDRAAGGAEPLGAPGLEFIAAGAEILERPQLTALVRVVAQHQLARRADGDAPWMGGRHGRHGPRRGHRGPGGGFGFFADLDLSQAQKDDIAAARAQMRATVAPLREQLKNGELTPEEFHAAASVAHDAFRAAVEQILTAEQRAQVEAKQKERLIAQLERRVAHHDAASARHLQLLTKILQLDDAQVQAIAAIEKDAGAQLATILAGVKDDSQSPSDAKTALADLRRSTHDAIVARLTKEQAELFAALRTLRSGRGRHGPRG